LPNSSMMGVHFRPGGAHPFLGAPAAILKDNVVDLGQVWGSAAVSLRDALLEAPHPAAKFKVLEEFLLRQARVPLRAPRSLAFALRELESTPCPQTVRVLADRAGITQKGLIDVFNTWVGLPPKVFCRIRRFQDVLVQIGAQRPVAWADVACACGYFDQAHFIRDFQSFSGLNPSAYLLDRVSEHLNFVPIHR